MSLTEIFAFLTSIGVTAPQFIIIALIATFVFVIWKIDKIKGFFKTIKSKKLTCKECNDIINVKTKSFDLEQKRLYKKQEKIENNILKKQMNFAEEKLLEISLKLNAFYNSTIHKSVPIKNEITQYRLFFGICKDAMHLAIKDEIRRSFKENGFYNLSGVEFSNYVKEKVQTLISMLRQHIISFYPPPSDNLVVSLKQILDYIETIEPQFEDKVFELFAIAKRKHVEAIEAMESIENEIDFKKDTLQKEIQDMIKDY